MSTEKVLPIIQNQTSIRLQGGLQSLGQLLRGRRVICREPQVVIGVYGSTSATERLVYTYRHSPRFLPSSPEEWGRSCFSLLVSPHHLHSIILPLVPCPFMDGTPVTGPRSLLGGTRVPVRGGTPVPGGSCPCSLVPSSQGITGCPLVMTGSKYFQSQDWGNPSPSHCPGRCTPTARTEVPVKKIKRAARQRYIVTLGVNWA